MEDSFPLYDTHQSRQEQHTPRADVTWLPLPRSQTLDDTLPSPPHTISEPYDRDEHTVNDTRRVTNESTNPLPTQRGTRDSWVTEGAAIAEHASRENLLLPPPPPPPPSPPSVSPSRVGTALRTLATAEDMPKLNSTLLSSGSGKLRCDPHTTQTTSRQTDTITTEPPALNAQPAYVAAHRASASIPLDLPHVASSPVLSSSPHAVGMASCAEVMEELQRRCIDLSREVEAMETRARHQAAQHRRDLDDVRDQGEQQAKTLQGALDHCQHELQSAREQSVSWHEERQKMIFERRQHREQIARLERQHQQDTAKMAAQAAAHKKDTDTLEADVQRLRQERDKLRLQRNREERKLTEKGRETVVAASPCSYTTTTNTNASTSIPVEQLHRARRAAEERAVVAEQAFATLRRVWQQASHTALRREKEDGNAAEEDEEEAVLADFTESSLRALLSEGIEPNADNDSGLQLSNGGALRFLQYRDAIEAARALHHDARRHTQAHTLQLVQRVLGQLETLWARTASGIAARLDGLTHRVEVLAVELSTRCHAVRADQAAHKHTSDQAVREEQAALTDELHRTHEEAQFVRAQVRGLQAALARSKEPSRLVPIMSRAVDAVREARLCVARTVEEMVSRVEHVASAEAGKFLTDAFLVVVQTTATKAEAQVELLARQLLSCADATQANDTGALCATRQRHVSFAPDMTSLTGATPAVSRASPFGWREQACSTNPSAAFERNQDNVDDNDSDAVPLDADGFPVSLETSHQRDVYTEMQRLLRVPPSTALEPSMAQDGAYQRLATPHALALDVAGDRSCSAGGMPFCSKHRRELSALHDVARQLQNMTALLDNHQAQTKIQQTRIQSLLRDWQWTTQTCLDDIAATLRALLAEATEKTDDTDRIAWLTAEDEATQFLHTGEASASSSHVARNGLARSPRATFSPSSAPQRTPSTDIQIVSVAPSLLPTDTTWTAATLPERRRNSSEAVSHAQQTATHASHSVRQRHDQHRVRGFTPPPLAPARVLSEPPVLPDAETHAACAAGVVVPHGPHTHTVTTQPHLHTTPDRGVEYDGLSLSGLSPAAQRLVFSKLGVTPTCDEYATLPDQSRSSCAFGQGDHATDRRGAALEGDVVATPRHRSDALTTSGDSSGAIRRRH